MPLAIGNRWVYRRPSGSGSVTDSIVIVRDTTIGGEKWFISSIGIRYVNRADGAYIWHFIDSLPTRQTKFPLALGDTAIDNGWFPVLDTSGAIVDSTHNFGLVVKGNVSVTVAAGTFNCWKVLLYYYTVGAGHDPSLNTAYEYYYFAPGVGVVKEEVLQGSVFAGNYDTALELVSVTLK
jgi:hypothetical protein